MKTKTQIALVTASAIGGVILHLTMRALDRATGLGIAHIDYLMDTGLMTIVVFATHHWWTCHKDD